MSNAPPRAPGELADELEAGTLDANGLAKIAMICTREEWAQIIAALRASGDGGEATAERPQDRVDDLEEALDRIRQWSDAYPLTIFPEPDLKKARALLEAGGVTLDSISAYCMRHVVEGVGRIAKAALSSPTKIEPASRPKSQDTQGGET